MVNLIGGFLFVGSVSFIGGGLAGFLVSRTFIKRFAQMMGLNKPVEPVVKENPVVQDAEVVNETKE